MIDYLRKYPEFILIAMGASFLVGAIFNWSAITRPNSYKRNAIIKLTIYFFGEKGYRIFMAFLGIIFLGIAIIGLIKN